jgi:PKD repeat protein
MKKKSLLLITLILGLYFFSFANLSNGLVAHYPFNGNANDISGNNYNAVSVNATLTNDRLGNENSAYYFNGVNNAIDLGNILNDVFTTNTFSINMWFNAESYESTTGYTSMLINKWYTAGQPNNSFYLTLPNLRLITQGNINPQSAENPVLGIWNMVTISMSNRVASVYLNGQLVSVSSNHNCNSTTYALIIGCLHNGAYGYKGAIDEVRIYNRPLNQTDINDLYYETLRAEFSSDVRTGSAPLTVNFSDNSFTNSTITSWKWDFNNDGVIDSEEQNPQFTYNTEGLYAVKLIVSDGTYTDSIIVKDYISILSLNVGMVAYYPFNGNANDESGNGYDAVSINATLTADRFGNENSAYYFNGGTDNITLGDILDEVFTTNKFSINMWVKPENIMSNNPGNYGMLMSKWHTSPGATNNSFILYGRNLLFVTANNQAGAMLNSPELNSWSMVTVSVNLGVASIYLNGQLVGSSSNHVSLASTFSLIIGNLHNGVYGFKGSVDEVRIYNRPLIQDEVKKLYRLNLEDGLVAHYPFNGNANDISGNNYNAVSVNATLTNDRLGNENSAYYFNGVNNAINLGNILNDVFTTNTFSINMWFNAESYESTTGYTSMLINKWYTAGQPNNSFYFTLPNLRLITQGNINPQSTENPELGVWNMVTISMSNRVASVYLNGQLVSVSSNHNCNSTTYALIIGCLHNGYYGYKGTIDDVRIYNRPLNQTDINDLYYETLRAEFSSDVRIGSAPLTVNFTDNSFTNSTITSWKWDFNNDGEVDSEEQNPTYTYETIGKHSVKLVISDGANIDSIFMKDMITVYNLNDQLFAHYQFDGNTLDSSPNEFHGIGSNISYTFDRFKNAGKAAKFNGTSSYIELPNAARFEPGLTKTIAFWLKTTQTTRFDLIEQRTAGSEPSAFNFGILYQHVGDNEVQFSYPAYNAGTMLNSDIEGFRDGSWHFFVFSKDMQSGLMNVYMDNELVSQSTISDAPFNVNGTLCIGKNNINQGFFNGDLDDLRIYNRALFPYEMEILYAKSGISSSASQLFFQNVAVGEVSVEQVISVYGYMLNSELNVTAPEGFTLSLTYGGEFESQISLTPESGVVGVTPVYVRFEPTVNQQYSGIIALTSEGATPVEIAVTGNVSGTNVNELNGEQFNLYPNPFSNIIRITNTTDISRVTLASLTGQVLIDMEVRSEELISIETETLVRGMYIVTLTNLNGERISLRAVKQ